MTTSCDVVSNKIPWILKECYNKHKYYIYLHGKLPDSSDHFWENESLSSEKLFIFRQIA